MSQEKFNILISSDQRLKTFDLTLSKTSFFLLGSTLAIAAFILTFVVLDYFNLVLKETKHSYLLEQNRVLRSKLKEFSNQMELVNVDLQRVNQFSRKLKAITSGGNEHKKLLELSLGAPLVEIKEQELESKQEQAFESLNPDLSEASFGSLPLFKKNNFEYAFANPIAEADIKFLFKETLDKTKKTERELTLLFEQIASKRDLLQATPSISPSGGGVGLFKFWLPC